MRQQPAANPLVPRLLALGTLLLTAMQASAAPATQPAAKAATLSGKVTAEAGKRLPEMIVFLEPADAGRTFPPPAEPVHISQRQAQFTPNVVVVCVGQAVDFSNDETTPVEHNVFSRSPAKPFDLGLYRPATGPRLVTFDKPGPVRLACSIHRFMDGVVYVCPTPFYARVNPDDGTYRIDGVPPGAWRVRTWQRNQRFNDRDVAVNIGAGQVVEQNLEMSRK
ncbi:MAG TPA: hypothetical protein VF796_09345 [Humisphaera sp.]